MKKFNLKYVILASFILLVPNIVLATDYVVCGNNKKFPLVFADIFSILITVGKILVPILLVFSGMLSFFKAMVSSHVDDDLKKAKSNLVNSIIAAVVIFLIVVIVDFVISLIVGSNNQAMDCFKCFLDPNSCIRVDSTGTKICPGLITEQYKYDENCNLKPEYKNTSAYGETVNSSNWITLEEYFNLNSFYE